MNKNLRVIIVIAVLAMTMSSCSEAVPEETVQSRRDSAMSARLSNLPLREIMRGLETDLASVAHGIWIEDHDIVQAAANRIAEHPKVIPEQMAVIREALGAAFPGFVQQDQAVHDAAVALVEAVESSRTTSELFGIYVRVQQGCVSCHGGFRTRVANALTDAGGGL